MRSALVRGLSVGRYARHHTVYTSYPVVGKTIGPRTWLFRGVTTTTSGEGIVDGPSESVVAATMAAPPNLGEPMTNEEKEKYALQALGLLRGTFDVEKRGVRARLDKKREYFKENERKLHVMDSGSSEAQIIYLTGRIQHLQQHCAKHKKDHSTKRGLKALLARRHKQLDYLKKNRPDRYAAFMENKPEEIIHRKSLDTIVQKKMTKAQKEARDKLKKQNRKKRLKRLAAMKLKSN